MKACRHLEEGLARKLSWIFSLEQLWFVQWLHWRPAGICLALLFLPAISTIIPLRRSDRESNQHRVSSNGGDVGNSRIRDGSGGNGGAVGLGKYVAETT